LQENNISTAQNNFNRI